MSRIAVLLLCLAPLVSAAPPYYRKADTWHETLRLSREALMEKEAKDAAEAPPKGFKPVIPQFDISTTEGQITALQSPAVNVRSQGFLALKAQGEKAIPAVSKLLNADNQYFRARAVWLLSQLGPKGADMVDSLLKRNQDDRVRTVAYRAVRKENQNFRKWSNELSKDPSSAVRREVALAMRDETAGNAIGILSNIADRYDGEDRWMLEAIGTGSAKKEAEVYAAISSKLGNSDPLKWTQAFANLAWRLHPEAATDAFKVRALSGTLPVEARKAALVALAYIGTRPAAYAILDAAQTTGGPVQAEAMWWLINRKDSAWKDYGLNAELKNRGLYDPDKIEITEFIVPVAPESKLTVEQVSKLTGDVDRGKLLITACYTCHKVGATGVEYGPDLTLFAKMQPTEVVIRSIISPSAD
ncbi:HEAT repeat domain-containing protein, partial [bacterium]|nr:HEAT repeat domain-containing protein [bacterium]